MTSTAKDMHRCLRNLHRFTDAQVTVVDWNIDTKSILVIDVCPNSGLYEGGNFRFRILVKTGVPLVTCVTNIYHPNIDPTDWIDNVCLNILQEWKPSYGLQDCIQGILFLFHNPNLSSPHSPYFGGLRDEDEFAKNVRRSLLGEEVEGVTFVARQTPTATDMTTTTDRKQEDTIGLENTFADPKKEGAVGVENVSVHEKQEGAVGVENVSVHEKQEYTVGVENIYVHEQQEDTVGVENSLTKTARDFHRCLRKLPDFSDGEVTVIKWNIDKISVLVFDVCPKSGLYEGGQFRFRILVDDTDMQVTCLTKIYHPNIDSSDWNDNVDLDIFDYVQPGCRLQDCIQAIRFLFHSPNLSSPYSPYFDSFMDEDEFAKNVRRSLQGLPIEDTTTTERQEEDTFGLENIFADQKQEDTVGLENFFVDQKR